MKASNEPRFLHPAGGPSRVGALEHMRGFRDLDAKVFPAFRTTCTGHLMFPYNRVTDQEILEL